MPNIKEITRRCRGHPSRHPEQLSTEVNHPPHVKSLPLDELTHLYETLSPEERDELLQCLLIAASVSEETVDQRLEEWLFDLAGREFLEELA